MLENDPSFWEFVNGCAGSGLGLRWGKFFGYSNGL